MLVKKKEAVERETWGTDEVSRDRRRLRRMDGGGRK